tara:strand:- start:1101 stop:1277 length:177 start_codon:yes stop_codon:yes gene_type:complete
MDTGSKQEEEKMSDTYCKKCKEKHPGGNEGKYCDSPMQEFDRIMGSMGISVVHVRGNK